MLAEQRLDNALLNLSKIEVREPGDVEDGFTTECEAVADQFMVDELSPHASTHREFDVSDDQDNSRLDQNIGALSFDNNI